MRAGLSLSHSLLYAQGFAECHACSRCPRNVPGGKESSLCILWLLGSITAQACGTKCPPCARPLMSWATRAAGPLSQRKPLPPGQSYSKCAQGPEHTLGTLSPWHKRKGGRWRFNGHVTHKAPLERRTKNILQLWLNITPAFPSTKLVLLLGWGLICQLLGALRLNWELLPPRTTIWHVAVTGTVGK